MKYFFLYACLWIISASSAQNTTGNNSEKQQEIIACERLIYEGQTNAMQNTLLLKKAKLYRELGDYSNAVHSLNRVSSNLTKEEDYTFIYERLINNYMLDSLYTTADYLNELKQKFPDSLFSKNIFYLHCMSIANTLDADSLSKTIHSFANYHRRTIELKTVDSIVKLPRFKNMKIAIYLSYILPGSGQIYGGKWIDGTVSLSLNAALISYTLYCFRSGFYINSVVTGFSFFSSFYGGGRRYAKNIILRENEKRKQAYLKKVEHAIYLLTN